MSSRKIRYKKADGSIVTEKFTFNKNKKYKFNKSTGAVEEFTGVPAEDEITIPGSKSSLRRLAEVERNISILASKAGVAGQSNADTDVLLKTGKAADSNLLDGLDSSAFLRSNVADTYSSLTGAEHTVTGTLYWQVSGSDSANQRADARDDGTNFARVHWYGMSDAGATSNFRHAWYDGASYINVTAASGAVTFGGSIVATGDVTAYSDDSLKTNVQTIDGALGRVEAVRGVTFDRIDDGSTSVGVIAQELEAVLPEAVHTDANGIRHVAYGNITGLLIEAVKELSAEVKELKNKK